MGMDRETKTGLIIIKYGGESFFQNALFYALKYVHYTFINHPKVDEVYELLKGKFQNSKIAEKWRRNPNDLGGNQLYELSRNKYSNKFVNEDLRKRFIDFARFIYTRSKYFDNIPSDKVLNEKSKVVTSIFINKLN